MVRTLGDAQTHALITTSVSTGLSATAVLYSALAVDPEPFTKAALAIAAGCVALFQATGLGAGCGQTCVQATAIVNQLEPYLRQNRDNYLAQAKPRAASTQTTALSVFDAIWKDVQNGCSNPALGNAGKRCISERQRGGITDWFGYYRDPIANDPDVQAASLLDSLTGIDPEYSSALKLAALVALVVVLL